MEALLEQQCCKILDGQTQEKVIVDITDIYLRSYIIRDVFFLFALIISLFLSLFYLFHFITTFPLLSLINFCLYCLSTLIYFYLFYLIIVSSVFTLFFMSLISFFFLCTMLFLLPSKCFLFVSCFLLCSLAFINLHVFWINLLMDFFRFSCYLSFTSYPWLLHDIICL